MLGLRFASTQPTLAKVEILDTKTGKWLAKSNRSGVSTMFPRSWDAKQIKSEVEHAFANKTVNIIIVNGKLTKMWDGVTPSGVKVRGYLEPNITVYPLME